LNDHANPKAATTRAAASQCNARVANPIPGDRLTWFVMKRETVRA
jgi:hypothetical protein